MPTLTQLAEAWRKERSMRLIDADALNDDMYHEAFENDASYDERNPMAKWESGLWIRYKMFENCLDNAPSIDIVRCKECRSYDTEAYQNGYGYCSNHMSVLEDNDFCSRGERREP